MPAPAPAVELQGPPQKARQIWLYAALLALCTLAVYLPVQHHPFAIADDEQYIVNNPHLKGAFGTETLRWAFTSFDLANWHPVTWISHAADVRWFGFNPAGHHDMNLLLHILNALLLFGLLRRATGSMGRSFIVAMLFALHPANVETVAWIAERKNLLSLTFFLLALGAYGDYAARPSVKRYLPVAILYALGLMAKPQIITFPFVLLLWDYWPLERMAPRHKAASRFSHLAPGQNAVTAASGEGRIARGEERFPAEERIANSDWRFLILEKLPLFALSAASALITMKAQASAGALRYYPLSARVGNAVVSYVRYLAMAFWPSRLSPFYPHRTFTALQVGAASVLLAAITAFVIAKRRERYLAVGWFWFLGTLVPMIGLVQVGEQAMADRYAYLSFIGLFLLVSWGVAGWARGAGVPERALAATAIFACLALAIVTEHQLSYWSNNVTLWTRAMALTPDNPAVAENLGVALLEAGKPDQAMLQFQQVVSMTDGSGEALGREQAGYAAVAHLYLGAYEQQQGWLPAAIDHYKAVLGLADRVSAENVYGRVPPMLLQMKSTAWGNLGFVYYGLHDLPNAKANFSAALEENPNSARDWQGLGVVEQKSGDLLAAVKAYSRAASLQPTDVNLLLLAQALERSGQASQANAVRERAMLETHDLQAAELAADKLLRH